MISNTDYKFFYKAKQAAFISDFKRTKVGCVAVYHGNVIGVGINSNKTHPVQQYYNRVRNIEKDPQFQAKLHAEIACLNSIKNMDIDFSKVKLYIFRLRNDGKYGYTRPCASCMAAIKDFGIKHIYYSTDSGFAYEKINVR